MDLLFAFPGPGSFPEALQLPPNWSCNHLHFWSATSSVSIMQQSRELELK